MSQRKRKTYSKEFKQEAVQLITPMPYRAQQRMKHLPNCKIEVINS